MHPVMERELERHVAMSNEAHLLVTSLQACMRALSYVHEEIPAATLQASQGSMYHARRMLVVRSYRLRGEAHSCDAHGISIVHEGMPTQCQSHQNPMA